MIIQTDAMPAPLNLYVARGPFATPERVQRLKRQAMICVVGAVITVPAAIGAFSYASFADCCSGPHLSVSGLLLASLLASVISLILLNVLIDTISELKENRAQLASGDLIEWARRQLKHIDEIRDGRRWQGDGGSVIARVADYRDIGVALCRTETKAFFLLCARPTRTGWQFAGLETLADDAPVRKLFQSRASQYIELFGLPPLAGSAVGGESERQA